MFTRYASAITTGSLMTFSLLYIMQMLISIQPGVITEPRTRFDLKWIRVVEPLDPLLPTETPIDLEALTDAPLPPSRLTEGDSGLPVRVPPVTATPGPGPFALPDMTMVDGPLVALVRVKPVYPISASRKGLEGYVIVQFDVLTDGYVANISIIESSHRVFESEAVKAAQRFRFKPKVVNGVPQVSSGIQNLFRFEMND